MPCQARAAPLEVANALLFAEPRRITALLSEGLRASVLHLPLHVDDETFRRAFAATFALAKAHKLTVYDAAYLELAMRKWKHMKRRAAVEPTIGHCKSEHRMERNRLHAELGDTINALLSAAGMNFQKFLVAFFGLFAKLIYWLHSRRATQPAPLPSPV